MAYRSRKSISSSGFTLVEVLIAIFLLSIVVTTALASYRVILSSVETVHNDASYMEMAKDGLNRMIFDLQSIYITPSPEYKPPESDTPDPYRLIGDTVPVGNGQFGRLRFTSLAHLSMEDQTDSGIAQIIYYVHRSGEGDYVLRRSDRLEPYPSLEPNGTDPVLFRYVRSVSFRFVDGDNMVVDSWNSDEREVDYATPRAIIIGIELGDGEKNHYLETRVALPIFRNEVE